MNNLEDILKEFNFSGEFEKLVDKSETYDNYEPFQDAITFEIEQQGVVSTNSITCSSSL